ncbi:MAG: hemolysin III family protein [Spirochaetaceae bacterium]|nr:hemolysin III family protein [Spirochaetaceae bacterium]
MSQVTKEIIKNSKAEIKNIKKNAKEQIKAVKRQTLETLASKETAYAKKLEIQKQREAEAQIPKRYTIGEEIFNSVSHGIGAGLSIAALVLLIVRAAVFAPQNEKGFFITGFALFGTMLIVLYLMSTLYHALTPYHVKKIFGVFDHSSIYLLISGTYTPFCLGVLRQHNGWWLFGIIWGLTIVGISLYAIFGSKMRLLSAITYVIMGWLVCIYWKPLTANVPAQTVHFLLAGGIVYTVGVIFYALKKIKWTHCVWHLFVLAGSILHFFSVFLSLGN